MSEITPEALGIIAGRGVYPREFAKSARAGGVKHLFAVAFKGETNPVIRKYVDEVKWLRIGQLRAMLDAFAASGVQNVVMVGQIKPKHLFNARPDKAMWDLIRELKERNAETIFGAIGDKLRNIGISLLPASIFMEATMPKPGILTTRALTEREQQDVELGLKIAKMTSQWDVGQTVVIKEGTVLAVEAFEGTDKAIIRAGKLGGAGAVVVKVAKPDHDMRFDIPVIGLQTLKTLNKAKCKVLALEAESTILLEREKIIKTANELGASIIALNSDCS